MNTPLQDHLNALIATLREPVAEILPLSDADSVARCDELFSDPEIEVHDCLEAQIHELLQARSPERRLSPTELASLQEKLLEGRSLDDYGTWVHYRWSRRLVHLLDRKEFIELRTSRNRYLLTVGEQERLAQKRIGVVGLSVGQSVALALALERCGGELRLADPDTLELSNLNRIRAGVHSLGESKVLIAAREIAEIDPYLEVTCYLGGLTEQSMPSFFSEGGRLDLVIDECDGLDMKVRLREQARELRIPVIMQTSDRGLLDIERFDREPKRPLFHGLAGELRAADLVGLTNEQKVPHVLRILGAADLSVRLRASLLEVNQSLNTWPQLGSAVTLGGGLAADVARRVLLDQLHTSGRFRVDLAELISDRPAVIAPYRPTLAPERIRRLVERACRAPSGGNRQPWRWVSRGHRLELFLDEAQRSGLTDFRDRASTLALGAAAETLVLAAHADGLRVTLERGPQNDPVAPVAIFELEPTDGSGESHRFDDLAKYIEDRRTDRRRGDGAPLPPRSLALLAEAAESEEGTELRFVTEKEGIAALASIVGQGDRLRILDPTLHTEMMAELRWTPEEAQRTGDGIDVESFDLSAADRAGLELCRGAEPLALLASWHLGSALTKLGSRAVASSPALGLLTVRGRDRAAYFRAGRSVQRLWLKATEQGLALQPITFLPYAFARATEGGGQGLAPATRRGLGVLRAPYVRLLGLDGTEGEAMLFRLHRAEGTARKTERRPVERVLLVE